MDLGHIPALALMKKGSRDTEEWEGDLSWQLQYSVFIHIVKVLQANVEHHKLIL